jgi:hypothetical protein
VRAEAGKSFQIIKFKVLGSKFQVPSFRFQVPSSKFQVSGFKFGFEEGDDFLLEGVFFLEGGDFGGEFFVLGCEFEELFFGGAGLLDEIDEEVVVEGLGDLVEAGKGDSICVEGVIKASRCHFNLF